jgi:hypothetical protein
MADSAIDIPAIIRERALANGVDPDTLLRTAHVESGLDPNSANPSSSAKGLFQFTGKTWQQYGNGANPLDPVASADAGARFMSNNQRLLSSAGIDPTPGALYLSHFAGPGGALKVLRSDPTASAADLLGPDAVKANPFLAKMSAGDLQSWANSKMSGSAPTRTASATNPGGGATAGVPAAGGIPDTSGAAAADQGSLTPELMAQLQGIPTMLAKQGAPLEPSPQLQPMADPAAAARARIVQRAIASQPITG